MLNINYRPDIDGIRALAILLVVFYHALPSVIAGGFIGVDIFFVISGFLISRIIFKEISDQGFSFLRFYARRANRIFPALIFVLVSCWLFGWVSLLAAEYAELGKYTAAGAWFVSNIISWLDAGYFDTASEKKPELHLWSLGVEEQFYLVWPIIMFVGARFKIKLPVLIFIIALVSFIFNVTNVNENPESSFFLPYSRFWELLIGASLAYLCSCENNVIGNYLEKIPNFISLLGITQIIAAVAFIDSQSPFPGYYALLPTVGAVFLIASPKSFISRKILSSKLLVGIGLISYPLYLWHWPLLAFSRIINQKPLEPAISLSIIALSFIMALLTYRIIELPIKKWQSKTKPVYLFLILSAIGSLGLVTFYQAGIASRSAIKGIPIKSRPSQIMNNYKTECPFVVGLYKDCYFFTDAQHTERVLLIGDSHAGHLIPGLAEYIKRGDLRLGALILNGGCPPVIGIERLVNGHPMIEYGENKVSCSVINNARISYAEKSKAEYIVISVTSGEYNDAEKKTVAKYSYEGEPISNYDAFSKGLIITVARLVSKNKKIILVVNNPGFGKDTIDKCIDTYRPIKFSNQNESCEISKDLAILQQSKVIDLQNKLASEYPGKVFVFNSLKYFCDSLSCSVKSKKDILYRDADHLSIEGSHFIVDKLMLEYPEIRSLAHQGMLESTIRKSLPGAELYPIRASLKIVPIFPNL